MRLSACRRRYPPLIIDANPSSEGFARLTTSNVIGSDFFCSCARSLLAPILNPGAVVLSVHGELGGPDLGCGVGTGFEGVADDHRHLVFHLLAWPDRDEQVRLITLAPGGFHFRGLRLGEGKADLVATGQGGIGTPIAVLPKEGRLGIAGRGGGRGCGCGGGCGGGRRVLRGGAGAGRGAAPPA